MMLQPQWIVMMLLCTLMLSTAQAAGNAPETLRLPGIIGDNMVLQAEKPARSWGWAPPRQAVEVNFGSQTKTAVAGDDGKWSVMLDPLVKGQSLEMTVTA